jgi:rubrerythrin
MGIFNDISKKAQEYAGIAVDKAKDLAEVAADKAKDLSDTAKINVAIMNEQRELEKNYRAIGEWFVSEHQGDIPDAVKDVVDAITASKERIAQLEADRPQKGSPAEESEVTFKVCPVCGAASDSKFCPHCGAPMGE